MWIVDNSMKVLENISKCNEKTIKNIRTYDFSTLYHSIPHQKLKDRISLVIEECFK